MATSYKCPVCGEETPDDMVKYMRHVKGEIAQAIRKKCPDWKESDGICPECETHYSNWLENLS